MSRLLLNLNLMSAQRASLSEDINGCVTSPREWALDEYRAEIDRMRELITSGQLSIRDECIYVAKIDLLEQAQIRILRTMLDEN